MASTTQARLLRWSDASGQTFTGQFFQARTTGDTPPPLFVTYYNCSGFLRGGRSEDHTSELQSLMRTSYAVLCLKKKTYNPCTHTIANRTSIIIHTRTIKRNQQ